MDKPLYALQYRLFSFIIVALLAISMGVSAATVTVSDGDSVLVTGDGFSAASSENPVLITVTDSTGNLITCPDTTYCPESLPELQAFEDYPLTLSSEDELLLEATDGANNARQEFSLADLSSPLTTTPVTNPPLVNACGLDIVLIIDNSGSISNPELNQMKTAFRGFVNALVPSTPTQAAVVRFNTVATRSLNFTNNATQINTIINATPTSSGYTNWQDALVKAHTQYPGRADKPDLYIFASDGNPNRVGPSGNDANETYAVDQAVIQANVIKNNGVRIITLGIGDNLDAANLIAISSADAYYNTSFSNLANDLANIASQLCAGTLTVRKFVNGTPTAGWQFNTSATGGVVSPSVGTTDGSGYATFSINTTGTANVSVSEMLQAGYALTNASCVRNNTPVGTRNGTTMRNLLITGSDAVSCTFNNIHSNYCGDGVIQRPNDQGFNESCDGGIGDLTCADAGNFNFGTLSCTPQCTFNTSQCHLDNQCPNVQVIAPPDSDPVTWYAGQIHTKGTVSDPIPSSGLRNVTVGYHGQNVSDPNYFEEGYYQMYYNSSSGFFEYDWSSPLLCSRVLVDIYGEDYVGLRCGDTNQFGIDNVPPVTTKNWTTPFLTCGVDAPTYYDCDLYVMPSTQFSLSAYDHDCGAGLNHTYYSINGGPYQIYTGAFSLGSGCGQTIRYYTTDMAGNVENVTTEIDNVDTIAPITVKSFASPTYGEDDYYLTMHTDVTLTATDQSPNSNGCPVGVQYIHYEIWWDSNDDGSVDMIVANQTVYNSQVTFQFTEESIHELRWYAVDMFGNTEATHYQQHAVDDTPPVLVEKIVSEPKVSCDNPDRTICDWYVTQDTTFTITAQDPQPHPSGLYQIWCEWTWYDGNSSGGSGPFLYTGPFTYTEDSQHNLHCWAIDNLNNTRDIVNEYDFVDTQAPSSDTYLASGPIYYNPTNGREYLDLASYIGLTCTDNEPHPVGVDEAAIHYMYTVDGQLVQNWTTYTGPFNFPEESHHVLSWYCVDRLGNVEQTQSTNWWVDHTPPLTTLGWGQPYVNENGAEYITQDTLVTLSASDGSEEHASGVATTYYRITLLDSDSYCQSQVLCADAIGNPDGSFNVYADPFNVDKDSCHVIEYYSVDNVEKTENVRKTCVFVDTQAPMTTKTVGEPKIAVESNASAFIFQESFETGLPGWISSGDVFQSSDQAHTGMYSALVGPIYPSGTPGIMYHDVTIPADADNVLLSFWYDFYTADISCYDSFNMQVQETSDGDLMVVFQCSDLPGGLGQLRNTGWQHVTYNLSQYAGETVRLYFNNQDDAFPGDPSYTYVDDVEITTAAEELYDYYITQNTPITMSCFDQNPHPVGADDLQYRYYYKVEQGDEWTLGQDWTTYEGLFTFPEDSFHKLEYRCVDLLGNWEDAQIEYDIVDTIGPDVAKEIGQPHFGCGDDRSDFCYVSTQTPITVTATDPEPHPVGTSQVWCEWNWTDGSASGVHEPFLIEGIFTYTEDSWHTLHCWATDRLGNVGPDFYEEDIVDAKGPLATKTIGEPKVVRGNGNAGDWDGSVDVLMIHANYVGYVQEVVDRIEAFPGINNVDTFDAQSGTPTLDQLMQYDSVLVWSNYEFSDPVALGNVLADYSDNSGGVTVMVFAFNQDWRLQGRYVTDGYGAIPIGNGYNPYSSGSLGTISQPGHPVMHDVDSFSTNDYRSGYSGALNAGAELIASYNDGQVLAAVHDTPNYRSCDLGFFPPSQESNSGSWDPNTDGGEMMYNCLMWTSGVDLGNSSEQYTYITTETPIDIACEDVQPHPVGMTSAYVQYRYKYDEQSGWGEWSTPEMLSENFTFDQDSIHELRYWCVDYLGNAGEQQTEIDIVDSQSPWVDKQVSGPQQQSNGDPIHYYLSEASTVTLTCVDPDPHPVDDSVLNWEMYYSYDDVNAWSLVGQGSETTGTKIFTGLNNSYHKFVYYCADALGNEGSHYEEIDAVDNQAPISQKDIGTPKVACTEGQDCDYWITQQTPIDLYCTDPQPHPVDNAEAFYRYSLDGGEYTPWTMFTDPITFDGDSNHTLQYYCLDSLGNQESWNTEVDKVDTAGPVIQKWVSDSTVQPGDQVEICANVTDVKQTGDQGVGVDDQSVYAHLAIGDDPADVPLLWMSGNTYCGNWTAPDITRICHHYLCLWDLTVHASDWLGNENSEDGVQITVDQAKPMVYSVLSPHAGNTYYDGKLFSVYAPAIDFGGNPNIFDWDRCRPSGVAECRFYAFDYPWETVNQSMIKNYWDYRDELDYVWENPNVVYLGSVPYVNGVCQGMLQIPEESGLTDVVFLAYEIEDNAGNVRGNLARDVGEDLDDPLDGDLITMDMEEIGSFRITDIDGLVGPVTSGDAVSVTAQITNTSLTGDKTCRGKIYYYADGEEAVDIGIPEFSGIPTPLSDAYSCNVGTTLPYTIAGYGALQSGGYKFEVTFIYENQVLDTDSVDFVVDNTRPDMGVIHPVQNGVYGEMLPVSLHVTDTQSPIVDDTVQARLTEVPGIGNLWCAFSLCEDSGWFVLDNVGNDLYSSVLNTTEHGISGESQYFFDAIACDILYDSSDVDIQGIPLIAGNDRNGHHCRSIHIHGATQEERAACSDGLDNDHDGLIDYPVDLGCSSQDDDSETADECVPDWYCGSCDGSNGTCFNVDDYNECGIPFEGNVHDFDSQCYVITQCNDQIDNDGNTLVDYPADPGCSSSSDDTECTPDWQCNNCDELCYGVYDSNQCGDTFDGNVHDYDSQCYT